VIGYGPPNKDTRLAALPPQIVAENPGNGFRKTLTTRGKSGICRQFRKFGNSGDGERSTISAKTLNIPMLNNIKPTQESLNNIERSTISGQSAQQYLTLLKTATPPPTQQYLAAQQYPLPKNRSTISGQSAQQYLTLSTVTPLNNI
jgi:hypothetical protein